MNCKLLLSVIFLISVINNISAQEYYWSSQKKIPLKVDSKRIVLKLENNPAKEGRLSTIGSIEKMERINDHSIVVNLKENSVELTNEISAIASNSVESFLDTQGRPIIPTGEILFEPKKGVSIREINKICENQLTVQNEKYSNYTVIVKDYDRIFELANK